LLCRRSQLRAILFDQPSLAPVIRVDHWLNIEASALPQHWWEKKSARQEIIDSNQP
jgi:hypothetical protein